MITLPADIQEINRQLVLIFGETLDSKPKFRIVWSNDQTEFRKSYFASGIQLLHPVVKELPKYTYIRDRWVLERWFPFGGSEEIIAVDGGIYEPVWVFENKERESLRPVWRAVNIIARAAEEGVGGEKKTLKDFMSEDEAEKQKEIELFENILEDEGTNYGNQTDAFVKPLYLNSGARK